jgi:hypothetical protein
VLGALLPGTAFLAAGRRVLGALTLLVFLLLLGGVAWLATEGRQAAVQAAVDTDRLLWIVAGIGLVALLWVVVVIAGYRMLLPAGTSRGRRVLGALVVALLVAAVVAPAVLAGRLASTQRELIADVFHDDGKSATVVETPDPFGAKERVNVLLLGGDGGEGRDGVRTDTVIVASIATATGETTLFSLPRNLENLPFPADSPLADVYPNGFTAGDESESLLNAVYRNGPAAHPDILGPTDNPGADFLKLGVGEALGLPIDYYVLVNLDGFSRLIDAPGLRPRALRAHRLRPHGPAALHDRRDHRRRRSGHPAAAVPGPGGHDQGHRQHRHPAVSARRLRRPGVPGEGRECAQRRVRRHRDQPGVPGLRGHATDRPGRRRARRSGGRHPRGDRAVLVDADHDRTVRHGERRTHIGRPRRRRG